MIPTGLGLFCDSSAVFCWVSVSGIQKFHHGARPSVEKRQSDGSVLPTQPV